MFIDGRWYTETELAALVISLKADNERVVEANKKISGMYYKMVRTNADLMCKIAEQEKKIEELEEKHWDECRQIAQYDDESKKKNELLRTVGKLLIQIANNELSIEIKDEISDANNSEPSEPKNKATNYDKIKKMSVEEMAEFFDHVFESCSANCEECQLGIQAACTKITIGNWLKKEYTGDRTSEVSE